MDKAEATGWGIAAAGHLALLAVLSMSFATATRDKPVTPPMEVSFVEEVDVISAVPEPASEAPAQSVAPEVGPPQEAAPSNEPVPAPSEPLPPPPAPVVPPPQPRPQVQPAPKPAPPPPPRPAPPKPMPKPVPAPSNPAPRPAPPKPAPPKPVPPKPAPPKAAPPKAAPAKAAPAKAAARPAAAPAKAPQGRAQPTASGRGSAQQTRGSRLGSDFLKGLGTDPSPAPAQEPAAAMNASAKANIASAITRQVQPCADRQVNPGPGAERIQVTINLRLNRDGSLAARPRVIGRTGINDENKRYADRVDDLAVATFVGCSPLRGLPAELYNVTGGWSNFSLRYKLPG